MCVDASAKDDVVALTAIDIDWKLIGEMSESEEYNRLF